MKWWSKRSDKLDAEIRQHLEFETQSGIEAGLSAEEARYAALRKFGNISLAKEESREVWDSLWMERLWQDLRFAARTLRKQPGFAAMAILSLGLGIGANSAVFTLMNDLLIKTIPVRDPASLVSMGKAEDGGVRGGISGSLDILPYDFYKRVENRRDVFAGVCAFGSFPFVVKVKPSGASGPNGQATGAVVSGDFFNVLGIGTLLGRALYPSDADAPGRQPVAVISYDYWQQNFAADPAVIGKSMILNGTMFTVIGVAPKGFYGASLDAQPPDMWLPLTMQAAAMRLRSLIDRNGPYWLHMMGRLKPGVNRTRAQEWLKAELQRYMIDSEGSSITAARRKEINRSFIELLPGGRGV